MQPDIKEKFDLLQRFCKQNNIRIEAMTEADGTPYLDLNILNDNGDVISYDEIGDTIN